MCIYTISIETLLHAEPILLTADETESTQACGTLKGAEEQAVNVQMLSRGTTPQAPAQPASVVYQAAAGMRYLAMQLEQVLTTVANACVLLHACDHAQSVAAAHSSRSHTFPDCLAGSDIWQESVEVWHERQNKQQSGLARFEDDSTQPFLYSRCTPYHEGYLHHNTFVAISSGTTHMAHIRANRRQTAGRRRQTMNSHSGTCRQSD